MTDAAETKAEVPGDRASTRSRRRARREGDGAAPYLQAAPMAFVFLVVFVLPLAATVVVSFWQYTRYSIEPAFTFQNYGDVFYGCPAEMPDLCTTFLT